MYGKQNNVPHKDAQILIPRTVNVTLHEKGNIFADGI